MTLAALIAAYHESDEPGGGLRATLTLAGRTLVERQARLAAAAGASPIILAVERVPPELTAAIDRLRGEGLKMIVARSAAEAAEAVEPQERLLLLGDGLIAAETHMTRLAALGGHVILTIPDVRADDRYERIDSESRWAGLAMIDGALLQDTARMLRDWDLQSTLLRRTVQAGARQLAVTGDSAEEPLVVAEGPGDLTELEMRIVAGSAARRRDWVSRWLLGPLEAAATRLLMPGGMTPGLVGLSGVALWTFALIAFGAHWRGTGMALALLATPLEGIAERLGLLRMRLSSEEGWWTHILPFLAAGTLLALAWSLSPERGWGCLVLAVTTIAFQAALSIEMGTRRGPGAVWLAERKGLAWLLLPFAATGWWSIGLGALAAYAAGSFFWVQRQVHRPKESPAAAKAD
jgi:hypothetical protein